MTMWNAPQFNNGDNFVDFFNTGSKADVAFGLGGDDVIFGWKGNDYLDGGRDNDALYGEKGSDILLGKAGDDTLSGGGGHDDLYGGKGVDDLSGGTGADQFIFKTNDTGDYSVGSADTISDFDFQDTIVLGEEYDLAGNTSTPLDGEYSIWQDANNDYVVTYNDNGYHDIIVQGVDPTNAIEFA